MVRLVCAAQAQGVFSFFNKPGQKGQQGQQGARRTPQANSSHTKEEDARAVNEDWGNQQVQWPAVASHHLVCGVMIIIIQCQKLVWNFIIRTMPWQDFCDFNNYCHTSLES